MFLIDTNVAIYMRDLDRDILNRVRSLPALPKLSLLSWVELEGGVGRETQIADRRRTNLDQFLAGISIIAIDPPVVLQYRRIIAALGFSRPRILDRLIAASAMVNDLTLITINGPDFRDIPGLKLEVWPTPAQ